MSNPRDPVLNGDFIQLSLTKQKMPRIEDVYGSLELEAVLAIEKIIKLEEEFPGLVQHEMLDHLDILADSARKGKYPLNNWLDRNGKKTSRKVNYKSIQNHIDQENEGIEEDHESGRPPRLHAACRLMMDHCRKRRNLINDEDK